MNRNDSFEERLRRVPRREIPPEWRRDILLAASLPALRRQSGGDDGAFDAAPAMKSECLDREARAKAGVPQAGRASWLRTLFWPHPVAWAGVVAAWVVVLFLNVAARDAVPALAARELPAPSPQVQAMLREQVRLLAELSGIGDDATPSPKSPVLPRPRSQRREDNVCV